MGRLVDLPRVPLSRRAPPSGSSATTARGVSDWLLSDIAQYRAYHDIHDHFDAAKRGPGDAFKRRKEELERHPFWDTYRRTCLSRDAREALKRWTSTSSPPS